MMLDNGHSRRGIPGHRAGEPHTQWSPGIRCRVPASSSHEEDASLVGGL